MQKSEHATRMIARLTQAEKDALAGMLDGEGSLDFAQRSSISAVMADEIREGLRSKLGVVRNADAVRIGLLAGLPGLQVHAVND